MKKISVTLIAIAVAVIAVGSFSQKADATPSSFGRKQMAAATSTLAYLTAGNATTTLYLDSGDGSYALNSSVLLIQLNATGTNSILGWKYEYSQGASGVDCTITPGRCDWYGDQVSLQATTSVQFENQIVNTWKFASSTLGASIAPLSTSTKIVNVPTPTRYTRTVFFAPLGSSNLAIWAEYVSKKEITGK